MGYFSKLNDNSFHNVFLNKVYSLFVYTILNKEDMVQLKFKNIFTRINFYEYHIQQILKFFEFIANKSLNFKIYNTHILRLE